MADVTDVPADIYHKLDSSLDHEPSAELAAEYAMRIGGELAKATRPRSQGREVGKLWASDLGEDCMRKTWYKFNEPDKAEKLRGNTKFKFLYGNILEEASLYLAEEAGHSVDYQQERVEYKFGDDWTVSGRIDAVIDGTLVDVKSTSSYGFKKYKKEGLNKANDTFGYLWQLGFYIHKATTPHSKSQGGFLWIDKQNGDLMYDDVINDIPTKDDIDTKIANIINVVESDDEPPIPYPSVPEGKSGNMKLDSKCSYCDFKKHCHRNANSYAGLRGFAYNWGPVWLTEVKREPKVPELTDA